MKNYGLKNIKTPSDAPFIQFQLLNIVQQQNSPNLVWCKRSPPETTTAEYCRKKDDTETDSLEFQFLQFKWNLFNKFDLRFLEKVKERSQPDPHLIW